MNCENKVHYINPGVVESEQDFGLTSRDVAHFNSIHKTSIADAKRLLGVKVVEATNTLTLEPNPLCYRASRTPATIEAQIRVTLANLKDLRNLLLCLRQKML